LLPWNDHKFPLKGFFSKATRENMKKKKCFCHSK
jgi:hypothetical protein